MSTEPNKNKGYNNVPEISLDELINNLAIGMRINAAESRIAKLEKAGDKLAFLMLNGSTDEMRKAIWEWRELNPKKIDKEEIK